VDGVFHGPILPHSQPFRYRCTALCVGTVRLPAAVQSSRVITLRFTISTISIRAGLCRTEALEYQQCGSISLLLSSFSEERCCSQAG
jgi:hypothetical protein